MGALLGDLRVERVDGILEGGARWQGVGGGHGGGVEIGRWRRERRAHRRTFPVIGCMKLVVQYETSRKGRSRRRPSRDTTPWRRPRPPPAAFRARPTEPSTQPDRTCG